MSPSLVALPMVPAGEPPSSPQGMAWLDVRVIYVRVCAPALCESECPDQLVFLCHPREIGAELEVNGARIPPSEGATLTLRRDRVDQESSEAMYVSTDKLRLCSSLPFSVLHEEEPLTEGAVGCNGGLAHSKSAEDLLSPSPKQSDWNGEYGRQGRETLYGGQGREEPLGRPGEWAMRCSCTANPGWCGFAVKSIQDYTTAQPVQPSIEVCVVGKCCSVPVVLTDAVQLTVRKRNQWKTGLDVIPESDEANKAGAPLAYDERRGLEMLPANEDTGLYGGASAGLNASQMTLSSLYGEVEENGEISWFNAGVRVGVGIGLGMCIGMGIGVGILVRGYQATTRSFRRNVF